MLSLSPAFSSSFVTTQQNQTEPTRQRIGGLVLTTRDPPSIRGHSLWAKSGFHRGILCLARRLLAHKEATLRQRSSRRGPAAHAAARRRRRGTASSAAGGGAAAAAEPVEPVVAAAGSWRKEGPRREEPMWVSSRAAKVNSRQARFLPPRAAAATSAWQQRRATAAPFVCTGTEDATHVTVRGYNLNRPADGCALGTQKLTIDVIFRHFTRLRLVGPVSAATWSLLAVSSKLHSVIH